MRGSVISGSGEKTLGQFNVPSTSPQGDVELNNVPSFSFFLHPGKSLPTLGTRADNTDTNFVSMGIPKTYVQPFSMSFKERKSRSKESRPTSPVGSVIRRFSVHVPNQGCF